LNGKCPAGSELVKEFRKEFSVIGKPMKCGVGKDEINGEVGVPGGDIL
jgi:hypothetical protein